MSQSAKSSGVLNKAVGQSRKVKPTAGCLRKSNQSELLGGGGQAEVQAQVPGCTCSNVPPPTPRMLLGQETQRAELNEKLYKGQREEEKLYILDNPRVAYRCLSLVCGKK